jgi:SAM-dependent methyltransferase
MSSLSGFRDHFSGAARQYAAFRPHYPGVLFDTLARLAPAARRAWDCATGNGQAAVGLARCFPAVIATDASEEQLAQAERHPRVLYVRARAERSPLASASVDVVTVAQALHWFDVEPFFAEARRVLVDGGLLAVWSYGVAEVDPRIDRHVRAFYHDVVGPWWPTERSLVENGYQTIDFPFQPVQMAVPPMEAQWTLDDLAGYLRTWSATLRYREARGMDPVEGLLRDIAPLWDPPGQRRPVRWPLALRAGRNAR